jgi:diacylglycerol kinase family enzyme
VDSHPRLKARLGEYYYTYAAISTFNRRYLIRPPRVRVTVQGQSIEGVTAVVQNSDPYTYFGRRPIRLCEGVGLDTGTLGLAVLTRASPLEIPTVIARVFSARAATVARHRRIETFRDVAEAVVESADGRPFPLQLDGDYVGDAERLQLSVAPRALLAIA